MSAIEALLRGSIDYAGLFPPAELDMTTAARNYELYRQGPTAWALGRFIVPISRWPELMAAMPKHLSSAAAAPHWRLSVLAGGDLEADLDRLAGFIRENTATGSTSIEVDAIETKASSVSDIENIMRRMPAHLQPYIEIPVDRDPCDLITALARLAGRAKVRTGGVTEEAFPETADLVRLIERCVRTGVPFKATAGLHHPLRGEYRLTYAPGSASAPMFGFLNVFLAAAFLRGGMSRVDASRLLEERSPEAFRFDEHGIGWGDHRLDLKALQSTRRDGMTSFGSCSFTEPIADLEALHLLDSRVHQA